MNRIIVAAIGAAISAIFLATTEAQVTKSITFLAELQHVTTADHEVTKLKFTTADKRYPYVNDLDFTLADKAKFVYVAADGAKKNLTARTVLTDAAAKKHLKKGNVVSIQLGGNNARNGVLEVRLGPSIESKAKKE